MSEIINLNDASPAAPAGSRNVQWQKGATTGTDPVTGLPVDPVSAYMPDMVGDTGSGGADGLVPKPAAGDGAARKWLKATGAWLTIAAADLASAIFGASGTSHSAGAVPDPGASAGTSRYLREDATWAAPPSAAGAATQSGVQQEAYTYAADTGAANAYAVTLSPAPTIVAGSRVTFKAVNANTGASTLAVNGASATAILKDGSSPLVTGDISVGQIVDCVYDGTHWQAVGLAPALVLTPVLRGSNINSTNSASSIAVTFPAGSTAGDLAILFANSGYTLTVPAGWTNLGIASAGTWSACAGWKILTSGDISTGSVTVSNSGSTFDFVAAIAVFIGPTGGIREVESAQGAAFPLTNTTSSAVLVTDAAIYYASGRAIGTPAITPGSGIANTLQTSSTTNSKSILADQAMPGGALAVVSAASLGGAGVTAAQVIVQGVASSVGSVTSVGLTVPARQTVTGSPVTGAGTLAITDNTQSANTFFRGPTSGAAAAPIFGPMVPADIPATAVTPGSYTNANLTVGADGRLTAAANGSTAGITLTTTGTSGAATLVSNVLNIPQYTGGGGGTAFGPPISPTAPPAISAFTWVNQGSATANNPSGSSAITLVAPASTNNYRMLVKGAPATPYVIDAYFLFTLYPTNYQTAGLVFRESSSGKNLTFYLISGTSFPGWIGIDQSSGPSTAVANLYRVAWMGGSICGLFMRISDDGTNRKYSVSADGVAFTQVYSETRTTYLTADQVGFFSNDETNARQAVVTLVSWYQH